MDDPLYVYQGVWNDQTEGLFASDLSTNQTALSSGKSCGVYGLQGSADHAAHEADALIQTARESRASQYVSECYDIHAVEPLDPCALFEVRRFNWTVDRQPCPFVNETYCHQSESEYNAVKFSTGYVDAKELGVRTRKAPKFNRTTVCVPLNMDSPPYGPGFAKKTGDNTWGYELGPWTDGMHNTNYTFQHSDVCAKVDMVPSYDMKIRTHIYSRDSVQTNWHPLAELAIQPGLNARSSPYSLTMMFIRSCYVELSDASQDPIFPAKYRSMDLFRNDDHRYRPLACIDWIEAYPDGQSTAVSSYEISDHDNDRSFAFMRLALNRSTAFDAIQFREARALDAQSKVRDSSVEPLASLAKDQWIIEASALFKTSLSRVQYDAIDIATGAGQHEPFYEEKSLSQWTGDDLCNMFVFHLPRGYQNASPRVYIPLILVWMILGLMGHETNHKFSDDEKYSPYFDDLKLLGVEKFGRKLTGYCIRSRDRSPMSSGGSPTVGASAPDTGAHANTRSYGATMATDQLSNVKKDILQTRPNSSTLTIQPEVPIKLQILTTTGARLVGSTFKTER